MFAFLAKKVADLQVKVESLRNSTAHLPARDRNALPSVEHLAKGMLFDEIPAFWREKFLGSNASTK